MLYFREVYVKNLLSNHDVEIIDILLHEDEKIPDVMPGCLFERIQFPVATSFIDSSNVVSHLETT